MRRTASLLAPVAFSLLWFTSWSSRPVVEDRGPVLVAFAVADVAVAQPAAAQLLVVNRASEGQPVELVGLDVWTRYGVIEHLDLTERLTGDRDFFDLNVLLEQLPAQLAHRHDEQLHFAGQNDPPLTGEAAREGLVRYQRKVAELSVRYADPSQRPYAALNHTLPYDQVFDGTESVGATEDVTWALTWRVPGGDLQQSVVTETLTWRGPRAGLPTSLAQPGSGGLQIHSGDLHVHSCHGEAIGACAPSSNCTAETFQTSGSFSFAQLKSQYQVLGLDWFTATDHSYCINSDGEYNTIAAEIAAISDGSFLCLPDVEVSSDEEGAQQGGDAGDALCLGFTSANHMGAHGLSSRITGGGDGLLGFCSGLNDFTDNIDAVRAQGGYAIAHHPDAGSFAWNSNQATLGLEADGLHGVEIWNGASQSGQGGHVGDWVDWLLDGRVLYAYSGSDTHDEAFAFGANHVLIDGPMTAASLEAALKAGQSYVSDGPSLVLETQLGGSTLPMGSRTTLPTPVPSAPLTIRAHVNVGAANGTVTLFRGRVGDASESIIGQSLLTSGSFVFSASDNTAPGRTYYRAYVETDSGDTAYSNPIFLWEGTNDPQVYCVAKASSAGCAPSIGWQGVASASSGFGFWITGDQVLNQQFGILVYADQAGFIPIGDGSLCLGGSLVRTPVQFSGGSGSGTDCTGQLTFDFNVHIASGADPSLTAGTTVYAQYWYRDPSATATSGLTDAVQFVINP